MRLLVACKACRRQYDASGLAPGKRLRCHCGEVIEVQEPRGHDAVVVRCSSCGAPREQASTHCAHCGSDFTLHELDLHTVCPNCLTRVSDRATFCHSCGGELAAEMVAGESTLLPCPACDDDPHMISRRLGKERVTVMECDRCAGLWIGNQTFTLLTQRFAAEAAHREATDNSPRVKPPGLKQEAGTRWQYRKCPECHKLMVRRHYGSGSGVIIDFCRDHGTWFDAQELPAILGWIRAGGQKKSDAEERRAEQQRERNRRPTGTGSSLGPLSSDPYRREGSYGDSILVEAIFEVIERLFS